MSPLIRQILGIVASYVFVFGFIAVATLLLQRKRLDATAARKVIHIGVAHWWLIAMAVFDDPWVASIGPASFIVINALVLWKQVLPAMNEGADRRNIGTVYFPISLLVLVNLCWRGIIPPWVGGIGILVLGWGDGLAALIGSSAKSPAFVSFGGRKSLAGTAAMFIASFLVAFLFTLLFNTSWQGVGPAALVALAVSAVATVVEIVTPLGIDNLTVPGIVVAFYAVAFL
jgi:phytol kinase